MRRHSDATDGRSRDKRERAPVARRVQIIRNATATGAPINISAIPEARTPFPNPEVCLKYYMGVELTKECLVEPTEKCEFICRFADVLCCQHPDRRQFEARLKKRDGYHRKYGEA